MNLHGSDAEETKSKGKKVELYGCTVGLGDETAVVGLRVGFFDTLGVMFPTNDSYYEGQFPCCFILNEHCNVLI